MKMTWFGKQAPCPLEEARRRHLRLLKTAMRDTQGEDVGLVKQLLDRLLTLVWDLPGDWQMFRGTLDLYTHALERGYEDQSRVHRRERGEHSALLMAAAFWCCQTLPQYEIEAEDGMTGELHVWSYERQRFFDWLRKWGDHERLPAYEAKAAEGTRLTPVERMWFATWLVPSGFVHQAGRVHGGGFWAFVLADEPTTDLHRRLDLLPAPAPPGDEVRPHNLAPPGGGTQPHQEVGSDDEMPSDAVVRSFLRTIATALRDGTVRVNTHLAPAFADAERTFLVYPKAVTLCFGATYRPQVVLDHLVAAGLSGGLEQVRLTPEGRDRAAVLYGFYLRSADLGYIPEVIFEGTIEGVA